MLLVGTYVYFYFTCPDSPATLDVFTSFWVQAVLATEIFLRKGYIAAAGCILTVNSYISTISTYISSYGWQYSKLLLISLMSHLFCVRIIWALTFRKYRVRITWICFLDTVTSLLTLIAIASSSKLSWIFWVPYYYIGLLGNSRLITENSQPTVVILNQSLVWLSRHVQFPALSTASLDEISVSFSSLFDTFNAYYMIDDHWPRNDPCISIVCLDDVHGPNRGLLFLKDSGPEAINPIPPQIPLAPLLF
jgi:hypothetical protein